MFSGFRYRLYPDKKTEERLQDALAVCCYLYNKSLTERKMHYKDTGHGLCYKEQANALPIFKDENPAFKEVHSQVLQNVIRRLERSFENFFEGRARYPKPKKESRWRSLTYPQADARMLGHSSIVLPKIGRIRMVKHRPIKGLVKTITVLRTKAQEWYAVVTTEMGRVESIQKPKNPVGMDKGLRDYIYLSDGAHVENPKFINSHGKRIIKAQKTLSRRVKGSQNRWKANIILARRWNGYTDEKNDWQWKLARSLVSRYDLIGYERLRVANMLRNHRLARAIQDAAWSGFDAKVAHVAAMAGTLTVGVDPRYSTQECPSCHSRIRMSLSERTHVCPSCGFTAPRDMSAGLIVKQRAMRQLGMDVPEVTPMEMRPIPDVAAIATSGELCRGSGKQVLVLRPQGGESGTGSP